MGGCCSYFIRAPVHSKQKSTPCPSFPWCFDFLDVFLAADFLGSETGRIRFRRARFQTPNSVSFFGLTEFQGANSVSSSQPIIWVSKRTHRVFFAELTEFFAELTESAVKLSEFSSPKQHSRNSTVLRPFPIGVLGCFLLTLQGF